MNYFSEITKDVDIIIIGGGISGCASGYFLSKGGLKVLIIEQRNIASGASGRNGSCVCKMARTLTPERVSKILPYSLAALKLLKNIGQELNKEIDFQQFGSLDIASSDEEIEVVKSKVKNQKMGGDKIVEFLNRAEMLAVCPMLGESALAAKYTESDGSLNPIKLTYAYALKAIKNYNMRVLNQTKVEEIVIKNNKAIGVKTNKGNIRANEWIINCTNAWLYELEPLLPFFPLKSIVSVTEKIPKIPMVTWESNHLGYYAYGTIQKEGNLIIGTLPARIPEGPLGHFDETVQYEDIIRHGMVMRTLFPSLMDVSIIRSWAGTFGMTPDDLPYIGPFPEIENYFLNTGYSNGMLDCNIGAKLTSEFILNFGKTSMPIDIFRPERFYNLKFDIPKYYSFDMLDRLLNEWNL